MGKGVLETSSDTRGKQQALKWGGCRGEERSESGAENVIVIGVINSSIEDLGNVQSVRNEQFISFSNFHCIKYNVS